MSSHYTKQCNYWTSELEISNCRTAAPYGFSPPRVRVDSASKTVSTTRGVSLDVFIDRATDRDAALAIRSAFYCLQLLHDQQMLHLDARAPNFIISNVYKCGATGALYSDEVVRYCYAIDYESMYVPHGQDTRLFNREALAMQKYGRRQHAEYATIRCAYRFDVHALAESIVQAFPSRDLLCSACRQIVNHKPERVHGLDRQYKEHTWTEYLLDHRNPVMTVLSAVCLLTAVVNHA